MAVRLNAMALIGMSPASSAMGDEDRQRIVAAVMRDSSDLMQRHTDNKGFGFELSANVAVATLGG